MELSGPAVHDVRGCTSDRADRWTKHCIWNHPVLAEFQQEAFGQLLHGLFQRLEKLAAKTESPSSVFMQERTLAASSLASPAIMPAAASISILLSASLE